MAGKRNRALYQLKVTLEEIQPLIWRRIGVWEDATLAQLHRILQIVMGWEDYPSTSSRSDAVSTACLTRTTICTNAKSLPRVECGCRRLSRGSERDSSTCMTSAIAGGMTCCWKQWSCPIRKRSNRTASRGRGAAALDH